ncbi:MAG: hypothetical protein KAU14_01690, partial [Thermoplasmata archaeon]|nr:hypothetical protein [Thermoplasmata archaeon]
MTGETDFSVVENIWEIRGTIRAETPLRIGTSSPPPTTGTRAAVLQGYNAETGNYEPFIPGAGLKGVLRSNLERVARSFDEGLSCVLTNEQRQPCGRPECLACGLFGGMKAAGRVRVQDSRIVGEKGFELTDERPHNRDRYDGRGEYYRIKPIKGGRGFRTEEVILPQNFSLNIRVDNVSEEEIGLLLLALSEFNHRRAQIGGGASRGHGFASVDVSEVVRKEVKEDAKEFYNLTETPRHPEELMKKGMNFLLTNRDNAHTGKDFSVYYRATDSSISGNIVCEIEAICETEFLLKGDSEGNTVNVQGMPVIPGSTIKGFLKKHLARDWNVSRIDDIFGPSNPKSGHRSRVLVSDFFNPEIEGTKRIPAGSRLKGWIVFDNMEERDIGEVLQVLGEENQ